MARSPMSIEEARLFHDEVLVFDLHADTPKLMQWAGWNIAARHERRRPRQVSLFGHVDLPRMRDGGIGAQVFGMWTWPYPQRGCAASVHGQIDALTRAADKHGDEMVFCRSGDDVRQARRDGKIAALAGIEGGQAIEGTMDNLAAFASRGVRSLGLVHFTRNAIGAPAFGIGSKDESGLSDFGRDVVREMNRLGVIVDLAHINRAGFFEALEISSDPCLVTHTGVSGVHQRWRNIDDEQIRAVAARGGAVGVIFATQHIGGNTVDRVADHILHVVDVAGEDAPALGSDFDGFVTPPAGLEDASMVPALTAALAARGVALPVLEKILGGNALRVLDAVPPRAGGDA
ncbi:MAG TPA: dipeptidase [Kofleriaceae bacterium]